MMNTSALLINSRTVTKSTSMRVSSKRTKALREVRSFSLARTTISRVVYLIDFILHTMISIKSKD